MVSKADYQYLDYWFAKMFKLGGSYIKLEHMQQYNKGLGIIERVYLWLKR